MTTIVTILTEGYADWEIAMLTGSARSFYGMKILHAARAVGGGGYRVYGAVGPAFAFCPLWEKVVRRTG